jgi:hypothetical protein
MPGKLSRVSTRKVAANRQNALKSTGPKTPRGKAYSRRNALKHGLFAMDLYVAALTEWEDPGEYQNLLDRLAKDYQPVGVAEELEVQRIAMCWWKLSRAWRYENAEIAFKLCARQVGLSKLETFSSEDKAWLVLLKNAEPEIETTGKISEELKAKIFADAEYRKLWESAEADFYQFLARRIGLPSRMMKELVGARPDQHTQVLLATTRYAALALVRERSLIAQGCAKLANDIEAIPPAETLDRVLRAEAAAERSLGRAIDQLERLQRRRLGEAVPPPVSVRLTR